MTKKLMNYSFEFLLIKKEIQNTIMSDKCFEFRLNLNKLLEIDNRNKSIKNTNHVIDKVSNIINLSYFLKSNKKYE